MASNNRWHGNNGESGNINETRCCAARVTRAAARAGGGAQQAAKAKMFAWHRHLKRGIKEIISMKVKKMWLKIEESHHQWQ